MNTFPSRDAVCCFKHLPGLFVVLLRYEDTERERERETNIVGIHALVAMTFPSCPASQSFGINIKVNTVSKENRIFTLGLYEEDDFEGG